MIARATAPASLVLVALTLTGAHAADIRRGGSLSMSIYFDNHAIANPAVNGIVQVADGLIRVDRVWKSK